MKWQGTQEYIYVGVFVLSHFFVTPNVTQEERDILSKMI